MKLPEPFVATVDTSTACHQSWETLSYYTAAQMIEFRNAALEEASQAAVDAVAFNGGTVQTEAHVRQAILALKEETK